MTFNIGPITLSIIQLFVVAIGAAAALGVFNAVQKAGSKAVAVIVALPVLGLFLMVAFFKVSELGMLAFIAKLARNNFFDTTRKFQTNYDRVNPFQILVKKIGMDNTEKKAFEQKEQMKIQQDLVEKIES